MFKNIHKFVTNKKGMKRGFTKDVFESFVNGIYFIYQEKLATIDGNELVNWMKEEK